LTVSVAETSLLLKIAGESKHTLKPTFKDAFEMNSGTAIRFLRDADGKIHAVSAGESRVWDLRFHRTK
jgi:hypothetical protein